MMSSSAWMTHVDAVRATCREKLVEHFDLYLQRAAACMVHPYPNDRRFGLLPPQKSPLLPVLRPPRTKVWLNSKFALCEHSQPVNVTPIASDYEVVKVSTTSGQWNPVLLETHEEIAEFANMVLDFVIVWQHGRLKICVVVEPVVPL
jgi:hypothetical protein